MMFKSKSSTQLHELKPKIYPADASMYELLEECGVGVTSTVHRARCLPLNDIVAIKRCNLDLSDAELQVVIEEVATMRRYSHPAVLPLLCSFVADNELWLVMPYMEGGSVAHVMRYAHTDGLSEPVIATIAKEVLRALEYLHKQGAIHRDVKAGNILLGGDGTVQLGDFGVSATMERAGSWGRSWAGRHTLAGTPCWMAPEVMEESSYNDRADIWSLGITLLEMAHGSAPFAKMPPLKVLLMTLQNPPPQLEDRVGQRTYSKSMREVVALCLQKDPAQRPSARTLLEHRFFKSQTRDKAYLVKHLLAGLPPLTERVRQLRAGVGGRVPTQQAHNREMKSRASYMTSVQNWDFNLPVVQSAAAGPSATSGAATPTSTAAYPDADSGGGGGSSTAPSAASSVAHSVAGDIGGSDSNGKGGGGGGRVDTQAPSQIPEASTAAPSAPFVVQHQPHAPEVAGSLVRQAFSDAAKNATAPAAAGSTTAPTDGDSVGGGGDGGGDDTAAAVPDHVARRAFLRGSLSLPDLKTPRPRPPPPPLLTSTETLASAEDGSGITEAPVTPTQPAPTKTGSSGDERGSSTASTPGGGGGTSIGSSTLRVRFAPEAVAGATGGSHQGPGVGSVQRKGRFQVYETTQPAPPPRPHSTLPLCHPQPHPPTSTQQPPSQPPSQRQSQPLLDQKIQPSRKPAPSPFSPPGQQQLPSNSRPVSSPAIGVGKALTTAATPPRPLPYSPSSTLPSPPPGEPSQPAQQHASVTPGCPMLPRAFAEDKLYSKWCDMAVHSLLAAVPSADVALQMAMALTSAVPLQYVPRVKADLPELDEQSLSCGSGDVTLADITVKSTPLPYKSPQSQPLQSPLTTRTMPTAGSGPAAFSSTRLSSKSPPRPPPSSRTLFVPSIYPPNTGMYDEESEEREGTKAKRHHGSETASAASVAKGGTGGGGGLVVVEVDETHPAYVALAVAYDNADAPSWAPSADLLRSLLRDMPLAVERRTHTVPLPDSLLKSPAAAPLTPLTSHLLLTPAGPGAYPMGAGARSDEGDGGVSTSDGRSKASLSSSAITTPSNTTTAPIQDVTGGSGGLRCALEACSDGDGGGSSGGMTKRPGGSPSPKSRIQVTERDKDRKRTTRGTAGGDGDGQGGNSITATATGGTGSSDGSPTHMRHDGRDGPVHESPSPLSRTRSPRHSTVPPLRPDPNAAPALAPLSSALSSASSSTSLPSLPPLPQMRAPSLPPATTSEGGTSRATTLGGGGGGSMGTAAAPGRGTPGTTTIAAKRPPSRSPSGHSLPPGAQAAAQAAVASGRGVARGRFIVLHERS